MTALDERAARELGFSLDDLTLNRQCLLSERQHAIVHSKYGWYMFRGVAGLALIWLVFVGLIVVMLLPQNPTPRDSTIFFAALVSVALIFVLIGAGTVFQGRDLRVGKVSYVDGKARTFYQPAGGRFRRSPSWEVWIGRRKFLLKSGHEMDAFEPGVSYRVYYVSHSPRHILLSAEALNVSNE